MREFVHQRDGRTPRQNGVHVHLGEDGAPVRDLQPPDLLKPVEHHLRTGPVMVLHEPHDAVGAALHPALRLGEHRVRLADAWRGAEIDAELAASHDSDLPDGGLIPQVSKR